MSEKSILEMVGGEKHINPHYDIKGFTGIEINGVRFSSLGEMLRFMDKQREQLLQAKELLRHWINSYGGMDIYLCNKSQNFIDEVEK